MRQVGERIRKARKSLGLTQAEIGRKTGDPGIARMLTLYENGGDHMRMLTFFKLSRTLGLTPNDLAPTELFPDDTSIIDEFLDLTAEQQDAVRLLIRTLKRANEGHN